ARTSSIPAANFGSRAENPRASTPSEPPRVSHTVRKRETPARPAVKTDIEELLPISQGVKSLPRPPKLPTFEAPQLPAPTQRRFPWMSLSIFAVVLGASLAPLVRYSGERTSAMVNHELASLREVDWGSLAPLAHGIERTLWGEPAALRDRLLDDGERALSAGDSSAAEGAFVQALSYGIDEPSAAFGLARVRLAQGDLLGARGWAETALRRSPQDARYRGFLERLAPPRRPH
ncbi:MAG: tetratricopeptide repeat protein, partial [Polyangiales bacterium]